jgi:hypothetical protein
MLIVARLLSLCLFLKKSVGKQPFQFLLLLLSYAYSKAAMPMDSIS